MSRKAGISLEAGSQDPGNGKRILVCVDPSLAQGQYRARLDKDGIVFEGQSSLVLVMGMRSMTAAWLAKGSTELTASMCQEISGTVELSTTEATFTDYGTTDDPRRLDYLFYNGMLTANTYRIMEDQYDGYISDHFGVMTEYSFKP